MERGCGGFLRIFFFNHEDAKFTKGILFLAKGAKLAKEGLELFGLVVFFM